MVVRVVEVGELLERERGDGGRVATRVHRVGVVREGRLVRARARVRLGLGLGLGLG